MLRVVAGELRGRKLVAPSVGVTRPTTDKVREAVFNALGSLDVLDGARVVDLYAGSGAAGIEALSRGAAHCTFVETDRSALSAIHANVASLGLGGRTRVVNGDAVTMAARIDADVAFADPPYDFDRWGRLLAVVTAPLVVAEAGAAVAAAPGWEAGRTKRYGRTWVTFLHRTDQYG
jgi:16S rRNA (guanine966-N2)-methyltransferase